MGHCDKRTGVCDCRVGWVGAACQYLDCPYSDLGGDKGDHCSGHGWCMNLHNAAAQDGVAYGDYSNSRALPATWDAFSIHRCMCSAEIAAGFEGRKDYPAVAPNSVISGVVSTATPLPGYKGYDCSRRNCPAGDPTTERYALGGLYEEQRIICPFEEAGEPTEFTLALFGQHSGVINKNDNAIAIRKALEQMSVVKNVTVFFPNAAYDHIGRACAHEVSYGDGGFVVGFITTMGDLPMLTTSHHDVEVVEYRKGTSRSEECSGPHMGVCDYTSGKCLCYDGFGSSNGSYKFPGARGDCSHHVNADAGMHFLT